MLGAVGRDGHPRPGERHALDAVAHRAAGEHHQLVAADVDEGDERIARAEEPAIERAIGAAQLEGARPVALRPPEQAAAVGEPARQIAIQVHPVGVPFLEEEAGLAALVDGEQGRLALIAGLHQDGQRRGGDLPDNPGQVGVARVVPAHPAGRAPLDAHQAQANAGILPPRPRVREHQGRALRPRRIADGEPLHATLIHLGVGQGAPVGRPPVALVAGHLLGGHELGQAVRDLLAAAAGELARGAALHLHHPQIAVAHERDVAAVGREARVEGRSAGGEREGAHGAAGPLEEEELAGERQQHVRPVGGEGVAGEAPLGHPHPLAARPLEVGELLAGAAEELGGRHQLARLAGGDGELVEAEGGIARGALQEQHRGAVGRQLDPAGPAEQEGARLGEGAQEPRVGVGGHQSLGMRSVLLIIRLPESANISTTGCRSQGPRPTRPK
jgi:hypothetical protein